MTSMLSLVLHLTRRFASPGCLLFALILANITHGDPEEASRTLILANANIPESVALAEFYAGRRGIPPENIVALPMADTETIEIREFISTIFNPLRERLLNEGWIRGVPRGSTEDPYGRLDALVISHRIAYLVVCRGVPLRMSNDDELMSYAPANLDARMRHNRAAVDSELSLLAAPLRTLILHHPNPLYGNRNPDPTTRNQVVRVSRLDGPTFRDARRLVDNALEGERRGLHGRVYVDARGPFPAADEWLTEAASLLREAHFDVDLRLERRVLRDWEHRMDGTAIYLGWYREHAYGPWRDRRFQPMPGAIGFHLHSFSATTVRNDRRNWVGPLIARGFAATVGNVYEPYLEFTHRPQHFISALLEGRTWGEAVYYSLPILSWQNIAIGDPLYRPFKRPLEEALNDETGTHLPYAYLRRINELRNGGRLDEAYSEGRRGFEKSPALPLALGLAGLNVEQGNREAAIRNLAIFEFVGNIPVDQAMIVKEAADLLRSLGAEKSAFALYEKILNLADLPESMHLHVLTDGAAFADALDQRSLSIRWRNQAAALRENSSGGR